MGDRQHAVAVEALGSYLNLEQFLEAKRKDRKKWLLNNHPDKLLHLGAEERARKEDSFRGLNASIR
jgi:hypothetical protein